MDKDVLFQSTEIKKLIVQRSIEHNIPLRYVCQRAGISYREFMVSYINSNGKFDVDESKFIKLLEVLGMVVRYQIIIDKSIDMDQRRIELSEWYEKTYHG